MAVATTQQNADANKSTAKCCASGFTLADSLTQPQDLADWACLARGRGTTQLVGTQSNSVMTFAATNYDSVSMHKPWTIKWARSDAASLSPSPPPLGACTSYALSTWTPGDPVNTFIAEAAPCPTQGSDSAYLGGIVYYLAIPIPIVAALIVGGSIWWCCARRRRQKREEQLATPQRLDTGESEHAGQWRDARAQGVELETRDGMKKQ
ncbi:hypothetical protein Micbo1qcDRAFT_171432 [Microdochium bolleyi]|uniref:Uncharacterized protein n=1 Tax=Microdochium bolleyi TaxID=196109 RepID=A0A136JCY2_9PEZI|nr:hypothetical protein Micbo1qcDRAFT_171432 [Microdochium bolleyi]